jgi:hypothetical protein
MVQNYGSNLTKFKADFNGIFGDILCLSHKETCTDEKGNPVVVCEGMRVLAFDEDQDEDGNRDDLIATGIVARSPEWLRREGSVWCLKIDSQGVRHQSDLLGSD